MISPVRALEVFMTIVPKMFDDRDPASLEDVLTTDELDRRPTRPPEIEAENRAISLLIEAVTEAPGKLLQNVADAALGLCRADSAGISVWEPGKGAGVIRWEAIAGELASKVGDTMPREVSPCGVVLDRDAPALFSRPERHFHFGDAIHPPIVEALIVPFRSGEKPVGAIWVIFHASQRQFESEDRRLLECLARFVSAAFRMSRNSLPLKTRESRHAAEAMALARLNQSS